jgi:flagellar hook protein FlgE
MFGSMFIGLSGMNAYSNGLRQISNNITNLNSTGFKSSSTSFEDVVRAGFRSGAGTGQGVALGDSRLDFAQGEMRQTSRSLDLAIDGDGFLVLLRDADKFFARTGSFEVNASGDIVLAGTDYKLAVMDGSGNPSNLSINAYRTYPPQKTTVAKFSGNLSSTATSFNLATIKVYDAAGESDNWQVRFERAATDPAGQWSVIVKNSAGATVGTQTLKFLNGAIDPSTTQLTFDDAAEGRNITLDFAQNMTSFSAGEVSTVRTATIDGYGLGEITDVRVNDKGVVEAVYSNAQTRALGSVAVATFTSPQSLEQRSGGLFTYEGSTGVDYSAGGREGVGRAMSKRLEASNVDLSKQFGELILVQRGYQASSQIVSVSNDMIQQLFGIRGQG